MSVNLYISKYKISELCNESNNYNFKYYLQYLNTSEEKYKRLVSISKDNNTGIYIAFVKVINIKTDDIVEARIVFDGEVTMGELLEVAYMYILKEFNS